MSPAAKQTSFHPIFVVLAASKLIFIRALLEDEGYGILNGRLAPHHEYQVSYRLTELALVIVNAHQEAVPCGD